MKILNILGIILLFAILTILSQVGGIILLLWLLLFSFFKKKIENSWAKRAINVFGFMAFYMIFNLLLIPFLAGMDGKTRLPMSKSGNLVPVTYWTAIFMRNYITVEGKEKMTVIADEFAQKHPGLQVKYMDCNYPFRINIKGKKNIPVLEGLAPHLSHNGDKADIAFVYNDDTGAPSNLTPTAIGYGSSVDPLPNESCTPCYCEKSNWKYSFMHHTLPKNNYQLNEDNSAALVRLVKKRSTGKILIERHLIQRFKLSGGYTEAGCHSVRHDDHFHVQF
ncbi:MAG: hypothetical protein RL737_1238 [Bacteroidota bacterium]|jgi:hypothetical protein